MKLIDRFSEPLAIGGATTAQREHWDLGDNYHVFLSISEDACCFVVFIDRKKNITFEVAKYLEIGVKDPYFNSTGRALKLYPSSEGGFFLDYTRPEKYIDLLLKIEKIVNENFKGKPEYDNYKDCSTYC